MKSFCELPELFPVPFDFEELCLRTCLVVEWIIVCLPTQGTWVRSLVREDSTCHGATKPHVPQLLSLCAATTEAIEPVLHKKRSQLTATRESPRDSNTDPLQPKLNKT